MSLPWLLCDSEKDISVMGWWEETVERIRAVDEVGVEAVGSSGDVFSANVVARDKSPRDHTLKIDMDDSTWYNNFPKP